MTGIDLAQLEDGTVSYIHPLPIIRFNSIGVVSLGAQRRGHGRSAASSGQEDLYVHEKATIS